MRTPMELLHAAGALDQLARDLHANHQRYLGAEVSDWMALPIADRRMYLEVAARTLRLLTLEPIQATTGGAMFHLANALAKAEAVLPRKTFVAGLSGKVCGAIYPNDGAA